MTSPDNFFSPRLSSLNDDADVLHPDVTGRLGEYSDYPARHDPKEHPVVERLQQFGVTPELVRQRYGKSLIDLTWSEHDALIAEAVALYYDTLVATVFDRYVYRRQEDPSWDQRWKEMMDIVAHFEAKAAHPGVQLIKRGQDFQDHGNLVLALEGGGHLIRSRADAQQLIDAGVRVFGLQYNASNQLADNTSGLTGLGREVVLQLLHADMVVDLAHTSLAVRRSVLDLAYDEGRTHLISYTHGSPQATLASEFQAKAPERGLQPDEIIRIIRGGGLVGVGVTYPFFTSTSAVAETINNLAQGSGSVRQIAIGADFGGVPMPWLLEGLGTPTEVAQTLSELLSVRFGMSDEDITAILRKNIPNYLKRVQG